MKTSKQEHPHADIFTAIDAQIEAELQSLIELRHVLHAHPELSRAEHETTSRIERALADEAVVTRRGPGGVGLIVDSGPSTGPRICVRADIDALALTESTDEPFASRRPGLMHACGHDVHTAVVLGVTKALSRLAPELPLRFLFQHAEEATPGGALDLVAAGAMTDVRAILTLHCDPSRDVGRVGLQSGPLTAAADVFEVTLKGTGGHGARPHETQDLVLCATQAIAALYHAFDRGIDARLPLSISVGVLRAGLTSPNVIPSEVYFAGTVRTPDAQARAQVPFIIERVLGGLGQMWGISHSLDFRRGAPPVHNAPYVVAALNDAVADVLGLEAIDPPSLPSMGGEDFAWYLPHAPGALLRIGTGKGSPLHSATFRADDRAIGLSSKILARAAIILALAPEALIDAARPPER